MNNISRRQMLKIVTLGLGSLAVTGCEPTSSTTIMMSDVSPRRYRPSSGSGTSGYRNPYLAPAHLDDINRWEGIIIHHSATTAGDATTFDAMHRNANGWDSLGYHFVINNGNSDHGLADGEIEIGIRWKQQKHGAHCRVDINDDNYWNEHTIGICLVGNFENQNPTPAQYQSLAKLVAVLRRHYNIDPSRIIGHKDAPGAKTLCPGRNFSWYSFNQAMRNQYL
ncbi:MAG: N-acetylmuramoyl-L-alanine amidase [Phycisphaerae bacterium]|nr:N-acetylmuramoyl-L-alanine amidase [Phycisphaerae bacterium]